MPGTITEPDFKPMKSRIRELMKQKKISQNFLAEKLGMAQSNMSRCLADEHSQFFTAAQLIKLADYFDVSLDLLTDREDKFFGLNNDRVLRYFMSLIESRRLKTTDVVINEYCHYDSFFPPEGESGQFDGNRDNTYTAFYFDNWHTYADRKQQYASETVYKQRVEESNNYDSKNAALNKALHRVLTQYRLMVECDENEAIYEFAKEEAMEKLKK